MGNQPHDGAVRVEGLSVFSGSEGMKIRSHPLDLALKLKNKKDGFRCVDFSSRASEAFRLVLSIPIIVARVLA